MPEETGRTKTAALKVFTPLLILLVDQSLKVWVINHFQLGKTKPLLPNVIHLTLVHNTGTAFGLFQNANFLFIILSFAIMGCLILLSLKENSGAAYFFSWFPLSLLLGGAMGNLIDRIRLGYVVDFIDLRVWPVFNLADSCITVGIFLILWEGMLRARIRNRLR